MLNVLCDKPSFTPIQKYGFHTGHISYMGGDKFIQEFGVET